jgi:hypothetical protein
MRFLMLVPLAALAACGGESAPKAKAPERAQTLQAGQWESNFEVTNFRRTDEGSPRLNMPNGRRANASTCLAAADTARPPLALFVGSDFTGCRWADNFYMRNGRLVSSGTCQRPGVGEVEVTISADFTSTGYTGTAEFVTRLVTDGDVFIGARIEGRRSGECSAGAAAGAGGNAQGR